MVREEQVLQGVLLYGTPLGVVESVEEDHERARVGQDAPPLPQRQPLDLDEGFDEEREELPAVRAVRRAHSHKARFEDCTETVRDGGRAWGEVEDAVDGPPLGRAPD